MVLKVAQQSDVAPFMVMDVLRAAIERQEAGKDVLHLEIGQPGFSAPKAARQAVAKAMEVDNLGYTDSAGIAPLRAGISMRYKALYGVDVPPERISATTGSSGGFLLTFLACFDPGDRVALADPSYPCYRNILKALGMEPVRLKVGPETRFQPTPEAIEAAGDIAGVIVASPSNPAGAMFAPGELGRLADWCHAKGIRFISDEIYHGLTYGRAAETAATSPSAVVVNSFSKYFAMTGWRIGWCVLPEDLIERFYRLSVNLFISPPTISQFAALAALDCTEELEGYRRIYAENREVMLDAARRPRPDARGAAGRGVLHLRRHDLDLERQRGALRSDAERDRRRGDARLRLRSGRRRQVRPLQLLRLQGGRGGSGAPPQDVAAVISSAESPSSARTAAVSWPSRGGGAVAAGPPQAKAKGAPTSA